MVAERKANAVVTSWQYSVSRSRMTESERMVVLVTGGSGLVGSGIKAVVEEEARPNETWIFLSSKVKVL